MMRLASTLLCAAWLIACTSTALLMPGQIRALPNATDTRAAILEGMTQRRWILEDEAPGRLLARIDVRHHVAKVWIDYDEEAIRFRYAGSQQLDCRRSETGCRSIHRNYNRWVRNLAIAIASAVGAQRADGR